MNKLPRGGLPSQKKKEKNMNRQIVCPAIYKHFKHSENNKIINNYLYVTLATSIPLISFEEELKTKIVVPENHQTMGAIGAALLAMENHQYTEKPTTFSGWEVGDMHFASITCDCNGCSNQCEVITIVEGMDEHNHPHYENIKDIQGNIIARWGGTCGRWDIA